jgi:phosphatidylglycerol:prolipoprotein diacylglycerol transferase
VHPILLDLGGFELRTYGALGALAFLLACFLGLRWAARRGWEREAVVDVIFWSSLAAIAGARLLFLAQNPGSFSPFALFNLRSGGMVFYGAPLLGVPVLLAMARRRGLPLLGVLDGMGRFGPLAHGISRLGCLGAGCCYGAPTELPWAITFHDPLGAAPLDVPLHPTQLYEAAGLFALAGLTAWVERRQRFAGEVGLTWLGGYAVLRSLVELTRGDADRGFLGPLSTSQAISAVVLLAVLATGWRLRQRA